MPMDGDEWLHRYGLHPVGAGIDEVRRLLEVRGGLERHAQGDGDTELMKLCCVQLFNAGRLDDVPLIWRAKSASMDAECSIDIQLPCGSGLARAKAYLSSQHLLDALAARQRLLGCEMAGDFESFSVEERSAQYAAYYA
ncbi:hypothetical protein ACFVZH_33430 [Streptomyces sp. NPDC059534]|uniref:hypothetical protein n=1 Tax=Streptomyces sp. NPDC059534 TaxID=3346859 RepID=UPI003692821F